MGDEVPEEVRLAAAGLKHVSLRCINLGVAREDVTDKHWIHYPEDVVFHRIFAQGNASPDCNPPGGFGLTCEISYSPEWKPLPASGQELIELCIRDCIKVGLLREDDRIITANEVDIPYGLVVSDHARAEHVATIKAWLARQDIVLAGAYGEWESGDADMALISGRKAAETLKWMETQNAVAVE
jgi:UDP-galactopyranose mutase